MTFILAGIVVLDEELKQTGIKELDPPVFNAGGGIKSVDGNTWTYEMKEDSDEFVYIVNLALFMDTVQNLNTLEELYGNCELFFVSFSFTSNIRMGHTCIVQRTQSRLYSYFFVV